MNAVNTAHMSSFAFCFVLSVSRSESRRNRTCRMAVKKDDNFIISNKNRNLSRIIYFITLHRDVYSIVYLNHNHRHLMEQRHFPERPMHVQEKVMIIGVCPCDGDRSPIW